MKKAQLLLAFGILTLFTACHFDFNLGEKGNGKVTTEDRQIEGDFDQIKGSRGLDIYLSEGSENKIKIEADSNLHELIETTVDNGKLIITSSENIGHATSKKVYVTYKNLSGIAASSGADIVVNSVLKNETLNLDASSGSEIKLEIFAKDAYVKTSSGADIKISGKAGSLMAKASSGGEINAKDLMVATCNADASSGGGITVNVKDRLEGEASSGGDVSYYGNPQEVNKNKGSSGSFNKM